MNIKDLQKRGGISVCVFAALFSVLFGTACGNREESTVSDHVFLSLGRKITTLDPALAADTASQSVCSAFYDTLLQYEYRPGAYKLQCAMLREMPVDVSGPGSKTPVWRCILRDDLYFQDAPPFAGKPRDARKVTSRDVVFSLLRLADARLNSPAYWVVRDKFSGIGRFRQLTAQAELHDFTPYDIGCEGFKVIDDQTFEIHMAVPDPRIFNLLALPSCAVVSRTAVEYYGQQNFADHPCGSGAYRMTEWHRDHSVIMDRYEEYREEYYEFAPIPEDRRKRLPIADRITCYLVRENVSCWLMFLQGELDCFVLENEQYEAVADANGELAAPLRERGIELLKAPQLETNYTGFHFTSPKLAKNPDLRRAVSLAFNKELRVRDSGGRLMEAYGPVPPGLDGALEPGNTGPYGRRDIARAAELLEKAGYPGGIDPATGEPLVLTFDLAGTDAGCQQQAEMLANDLREIGIDVRAVLNTRPRFQAKLAGGDIELFRYSWVADYPDAENFLQLFYSRNAGGSNRVQFSDAVYDEMYRQLEFMPESEERTALCRKMCSYLLEKCPWIFETHTMWFGARHSWMKHYFMHDFAANRWKYLSAPAAERAEKRKNFTPLPMSSLR